MQELRDQKRKRQTRVTETNSPCDHQGLHGQRANMAFPKLRGHPAEIGPRAGGGEWAETGATVETQLPSEMPPEGLSWWSSG